MSKKNSAAPAASTPTEATTRGTYRSQDHCTTTTDANDVADDTGEALRARVRVGEVLTEAEQEQLAAYAASMTDDQWMVTAPTPDRERTAAVSAWWDQHRAWIADGCPEGMEPGPCPAPPKRQPMDWLARARRLDAWALKRGLPANAERDYHAGVARHAATAPTHDNPTARALYDARVKADVAALAEAGLIRTGTPLDPHERAVQERLERLKVDAEARQRLKVEQLGPAAELDIASGIELAADDAAPRYRVDGIMLHEGSTLITAQRKAGKTTLLVNLARALLTGEPFLGHFEVDPLEGAVAVLNFEVSRAQFGHWASKAGVPGDRFHVVTLRGRRNPLAHPADRAALAEALRQRGVECVMVDPFANAFTGDSQNDAGQVAAWLHDLSMFVREEVGATELVLTNHAGWNAERTRGSSALEDWGDSLVKLVVDGYGDRYLSAIGRDVDVAEGKLDFDPDTLQLTLIRDANRATESTVRRSNALTDAVVGIVRDVPGLGVRELQAALKDRAVSFDKGALQPAIDAAVAQGLVEVRLEARGKKAHYPRHPEDETATVLHRPEVSCRTVQDGRSTVLSSSLYGEDSDGAAGGHTPREETSQSAGQSDANQLGALGTDDETGAAR